MVSQKYRWDFIGLSTDEKPTSETSDKVVNGSTYYCSDTSKLYVYCEGTWYERKPLGGGGGGGTSDFNELTNRPKYNGSEMSSSTDIPEVVTYSDFTGTDGTAAGVAGLVPAPATTDAGKFLKADGTWGTAGGGASYTAGDGIDITNDVISATNTGKARELTTDDYNYPVNNPNGVALWMLGAGVYYNGNNVKIYTDSTNSYTISSTNIVTVSGNDADIATTNYNSTSTDIRRVNTSNGSLSSVRTILSTDNVINNLTSTSSTKPLSAMQGKVLKDLVDSLAIRASGAPTTSTVGSVGTLYEDTTNGKLYQCTDTTGGSYTWVEVGAGGGSGPTVVQTTGTSTTDVMSQKAVTGMVFADPGDNYTIHIGNPSNITGVDSHGVTIGNMAVPHEESVVIGERATASTKNVTVIGRNASATGRGSVAIGEATYVNGKGVVGIGFNAPSTPYGYNNSEYRLLTGLYDPQSAHDAATKGYVDPSTDSSAPSTSTAGRLGQIQIDTTNNDAYMCVAVDDVTPAYTWKKITA